MERDICDMPTGVSMMDSGSLAQCTVSETSFGPTASPTQGTTRKTNAMVQVSTRGQMDRCARDAGRTASYMVQAPTLTTRARAGMADGTAGNVNIGPSDCHRRLTVDLC